MWQVILSAFVFFVSAQNLLQEWGQGATSLVSPMVRTYTLTTWNIYKGGDEGMYADLQKLLQSSDFVLMQEILLTVEQKKMISQNPQTHWALAKSFKDSEGQWTGVATASRWQPEESVAVQSPGREPVVGTPKMSLISKYVLEGKELWVVNVHALNFNLFHGPFKEQIDDLVRRLEKYNGALIFAGDFNTWADERREYLLEKAKLLGLERANLESPMGFFDATLDHIFYRGLQSVQSRLLAEVSTSDHTPLQITFVLP